jgi:hypothetical protein
VLRTLGGTGTARIVFGSCRVAEIAPGNLSRRDRQQRAAVQPTATGAPLAGEGVDALAATAAVLARTPHDRWPSLLLMIGDQVYADEPGPSTRAFMADHRAEAKAARAPAGAPAADAPPADIPPAGTPAADAPPADGRARPATAPDDEVADYAEYCFLYREAWSDPAVRWLLSVVPTGMIFDDHDVHDDWNTSASWRRDIATQPWWAERIESAFQSYWVYQHLGNLSPAELAADETWPLVRDSPDAAAVLADLAHRADQRAPGIRWSFRRALGGVRVVVLDSRSRRVVEGQPRLIADQAEWDWLTESVSGDWEHVIIASSVPPLLPRGIHALEAWTERLGNGAWGRRGRHFGERLRRGFDLEHWPAFTMSFTQLERLLSALASGRSSPGGQPPRSVTVISGDIHHSFLASVDLPGSAGEARRSAVYEAVCSPFHQAMPPKMRYAQSLAGTRFSGVAGSAVAALAGARGPGLSWRVTEGPWFANMIAQLDYDGAAASIRFDRAAADPAGTPTLKTAAEARLS